MQNSELLWDPELSSSFTPKAQTRDLRPVLDANDLASPKRPPLRVMSLLGLTTSEYDAREADETSRMLRERDEIQMEAFGAGGQALLQTPTSHGHRPTAPCLLLLLPALAAGARYAQQ